MSEHTTFKIGGPADIFIIPADEDALIKAVSLCREQGVSYFILGNGSNLLISDYGIDGVVISTEKVSAIAVNEKTIEAGCGAMLAKIAYLAQQNSLAGLEFAAGIPGTLGGAIYMNAGAYGEELKDIICSVRFLSQTGEVLEYTSGQCEFGYRTSRFQREPALILSAKMQLQSGNSADIAQKSKGLNAKRRDKQPLDLPSAGSVFKRPQGNFVGTLIEQAGLKGFSIGGAQVSAKHAGFIVNTGGATATDVLQLIECIKKTVKEKTDVELQEEIKLIGKTP